MFAVVHRGESVVHRMSDGACLAGSHSPVVTCVSVHDQYHMREQSEWRRRLLETGATLQAVRDYRLWRDAETRWYAALQLVPPSANRHRRAGRRRRTHCPHGHAYTFKYGRQRCFTCRANRARSAA
jgi:hypothetical protein